MTDYYYFSITRQLQKKADEMKAVSLQSAIDTCEKLEIKLTAFAKTHRNEIRNGTRVLLFGVGYDLLYLIHSFSSNL